MTRGEEKLAATPSPWSVRARLLRALLGLVASLVLTTAILGWTWTRHEIVWTALREQAAHSNFVLLGLVFLGSAAFHVFVGAHKLHCILRATGVEIRYTETLQVRLGAGPIRALLPISLGELVQLFYFRTNQRMPLARISGVLAFDKAINLLGALVWFAIGLLVVPLGTITTLASSARWAGLLSVFGMIFACIVVIFFIPAHAALQCHASSLHQGLGVTITNLLSPFRQLQPPRKLALAAYAFLFQLRPIAVCYLLLHAVGLAPRALDALTAGSAAVCAGYIPGFVSGSGPREAMLVELLRSGYAPVDALFTAGLLMTLSVHIVPALVGAPWTWWFLCRLRASTTASGDSA